MSTITGSVSRTSAQKMSERLSVLDFGAAGDGTTNDTAAITAAIAYCAPKGIPLVFPAKVYSVTNLTLTVDNTILAGEPGARLKFTGSGVGITITGAGNGIRVFLRDLTLSGNASMTYCIDAYLMTRGELRNVRCYDCTLAGVRLRNGVLNLIENLTVSTNIPPFTTVPVSGIVIDGQSGGNTLLNPIIEGMTGPGIDIVQAQTTTILGGSSEGCGTGITLRYNAALTVVVGIDLEVNSVYDLDVGGLVAEFIGCTCQSANSVKVRAGARRNTFRGGWYKNVTVDAAVELTTFDGIALVAPGTITDNGNQTVITNVADPFTSTRLADKRWADIDITNHDVSNADVVYANNYIVRNRGGADPAFHVEIAGFGNTLYLSATDVATAGLQLNAQGALRFNIGPNGTEVEQARIISTGMGIGMTPNAAYKLDVAGDINTIGAYKKAGVPLKARIGHTWGLVGDVTGLTTLPSLFVPIVAPQTATLASIRTKIASGTSVGVQVKRNGSNVGSVITVTTTAATTSLGNVALSDADELTLVLSSPVGTPTHLSATLYLEHTP